MGLVLAVNHFSVQLLMNQVIWDGDLLTGVGCAYTFEEHRRLPQAIVQRATKAVINRVGKIRI